MKQFKYTIIEGRPKEQTNHKPARLIKNHKTATALIVLAAVAAVLVASTAAVGTATLHLPITATKQKASKMLVLSFLQAQNKIESVKLLVESLQS